MIGGNMNKFNLIYEVHSIIDNFLGTKIHFLSQDQLYSSYRLFLYHYTQPIPRNSIPQQLHTEIIFSTHTFNVRYSLCYANTHCNIKRQIDLVISPRQKAFCIFKTTRVEAFLFSSAVVAFRKPPHYSGAAPAPPPPLMLLLSAKRCDRAWACRHTATHISLIKTFCSSIFTQSLSRCPQRTQ